MKLVQGIYMKIKEIYGEIEEVVPHTSFYKASKLPFCKKKKKYSTEKLNGNT